MGPESFDSLGCDITETDSVGGDGSFVDSEDSSKIVDAIITVECI